MTCILHFGTGRREKRHEKGSRPAGVKSRELGDFTNNNSSEDKQIVVSGIPSYDELVNGSLGDYLL